MPFVSSTGNFGYGRQQPITQASNTIITTGLIIQVDEYKKVEKHNQIAFRFYFVSLSIRLFCK